MATPQIGDDVHVEFDGVVQWVNAHGPIGVRCDSGEYAFDVARVPAQHVTVVAPPPKSGDAFDVNVDYPDGTVVFSGDGRIANKYGTGWRVGLWSGYPQEDVAGWDKPYVRWLPE